MRYFLNLSYDGSNFSGWQCQANAPSVQQTINEGLQKLLGHEIKSLGCGRTDAGVHAKDFYMHFDTTTDILGRNDFLYHLNCVLPDSIAIHSIIPVEEKANVRFDATERTYEYFLHFNKSAFLRKYSYFQGHYDIDWQKVLQAATVIMQTQDFTSLCLPSEDFKTNICQIKQVEWSVLPHHYYALKPLGEEENGKPMGAAYQFQNNEILRFTITSNRFLRGMVRKTVGTLLMVGKGKISPEEFAEIVTNKKDFRIHYLAPPNGLFLSKIKYPYIP